MRSQLFLSALTLIACADPARSAPPAAGPQPPSVIALPAEVDCNLAALMPHAPLTVAECKALVGLYQTLAVVNPDAGRDGDEQMTCSDIRAALSREHGVGARLNGRFNHSIITVAQGLSASIRANPRLGRLVQLAAARDCETAGGK